MSKLRVNCFSISLDGYGAGPDQDLQNPFGSGGMALPAWFIATRTFKQTFGQGGGETGIADDFAARGNANLGAWILGRNMFGPVRGPWEGDAWRGWWGDNPPYHTPVFVLTHHPRPPLEMEGGTVFHFVTERHACRTGAGARRCRRQRTCGWAAAWPPFREYLQAGLVDEMHFAISPVLLGRGEHLLQGIDLPQLGYRCTQQVATPSATHVLLGRSA